MYISVRCDPLVLADCIHPLAFSVAGDVECRRSSYSGSSNSISSIATSQDKVLQTVELLRHPGDFESQCNTEAGMVERPFGGLQWERLIDRDEYLRSWMESSLQWSLDGKPVVSTAITVSHQCTGITSSHVCCSSFCKGQMEHTVHHTTKDDQYISNKLCQTNGRTHSANLMQLACQLCQWYLQRGNTLTVCHLPGWNNQVADWESREIQSSTEWMLHKRVFSAVSHGPFQVDLFVT